MVFTTESTENLTTCMQLKGGLFPLTTLQILNNDLQLLDDQLNIKIKQAPNFFNNTPIIIDLFFVSKEQKNSTEKSNVIIDFIALKQILLSKNLIPVGVKNANTIQQELAIKANLPIIRSNSSFETYSKHPNSLTRHYSENNQDISDPSVEEKGQSIDLKVPKNKLISSPVRSGQQVYAPDGDLTIIGSVGHGAELLADGNIHVYGALRGRALAGINNNTNARIFCNSLEAELISIAGQFRISENIDPKFWKKQTQIYLINSKLEINEFL